MNQNPQVNYIQEDEIDLRELFKTIAKKKKFIAIFTGLVTFLSIIFVLVKTPIYEAKALIEIGHYKSNLNNNNNNTIQIENASQLSKRLNVLYIDMLKNEKDRDVEISSINIPKKQQNFIEIKSLATSNKLAIQEIEKVVNYIQDRHTILLDELVIGKKFSIKKLDEKIKKFQSVKSKIGTDNLSPTILLELLKIDERIDNLQTQKASFENELLAHNYKNSEIVGKIITNDYPVKPKKKLIVVVAFVTSLILAIFLVFFIEFIRGEEKDGK